MSCLVCCTNSKNNLLKNLHNVECVDAAFNTIKNHYLFYKNVVSEKERQIQSLQDRNEQLMKAVALLQREQRAKQELETSQNDKFHTPQKKRRKGNSIDSVIGKTTNENYNDDNDDDFIDINLPTSRSSSLSELNMALGSEQLMNTSSANIISNLTINNEESIAETEKVASPRVLRGKTSIERAKRRELLQKTKEKSNLISFLSTPDMKTIAVTESRPVKAKSSLIFGQHMNNENMNSLNSTKDDKNKNCSDWISKSRAKVDNNLGMTVNIGKTKLSLSKTSNRKLKQTRLQLDISHRQQLPKANTNSCDSDIVETSPNVRGAARETKNARGWMLRTGNDASNKYQSKTSKLKESNDSDELFNFSFKRNQELIEEPKAAKDVIKIDILKENTLQPLITAIDDDGDEVPSVMFVTPASQDVIFLDDTCDSTHMDTVLMQDMSKERENVEKLYGNISKGQVANATVNKIKKEKITQESASPSLSSDKNTIYLDNYDNDDQVNVADDAAAEDTDDSDDFMVLPIQVKKEKERSECLRPFDLQHQKVDVKNSSNINCDECQKFNDFMGLNPGEYHNCLRHKSNADGFNQTPEGFWNPLMLSFPADDPRNEILIDNRFVGKKRHS